MERKRNGNMRPRDRFLSALNHSQTDRVPIWDFINNPALYEEVIGQEIFFINGSDAVKLYSRLGLDGAFIPAGGYNSIVDEHWEWTNDHTFIDEWGTTFSFDQSAWPCAFPLEYSVKDAGDWRRLKKPDPAANWRLNTILDAIGENRKNPGNEIAIIGGIRGPFSTASMILGLTQLSFLVKDNPGFLELVLNEACDFWTTIGLRLVETGVDAVVVVDDMGANQHTLISPQDLRKLVLPLLKREVQAISSSGVPVFLHSCGNINSILPDVVDCGIVGLNNIQQSAGMDIRTIKNLYGDRLCLIGNVNSSEVMSYGNPVDVELAVRECIRVAGRGGGHILATDHSFHKGIPLENVFAFIDAGRKYGAQPYKLPDD